MDDQIKEISERLRGLRDVLQLSPQELADACEISVDDYLRAENGQGDIYLSMLQKIAKRYDLSLDELTRASLFAGMLGGRRFCYFIHDGYLISSDADFCILGEVAPDLKPEGPFADHVGYYSGKHLFPYLKVKKVLCKKNAIYPFTVVGRPPQEDTLFGEFIHRITRPMVPASIPGVHAVHAVDEAGVHPLCLALGSESFRPYVKPEEREPMELLKTANALLGFNQVSLTKYLMIAAKEDNPKLDVNKIPEFFGHILERLRTDRVSVWGGTVSAVLEQRISACILPIWSSIFSVIPKLLLKKKKKGRQNGACRS